MNVTNTEQNGSQELSGSTETTSEGDSTGAASDDAQNGAEGHSGSKLHREAAAYRVRAKEAEQKLTAAEERINSLLTKEVERLAADSLSQPGDLFALSGNELADYLDDDGNVDAERVAADVAELLAERPGLRRGPVPGHDPTQGTGGRPAGKNTPSWSALFS